MNHRLVLTAVILFAATIAVGTGAQADEPTASTGRFLTGAVQIEADEQKPFPNRDREGAETQPVPAPTPGEKSTDDELFRDLTGEKPQSDEGADNLLERIEQKMRTAGTRIAAKDAGETTREVQRDVVSDLEKLIEQARKQKSQQMQMRLPQNPQDQQSDEQQTTEQQEGGEPGGQNQQGPAAESSRRDKTEPPPGGDMLMQSRLVKDVWGHLPPALRQQLLNGFGEKSLPRYDDLVRRYFEALAEEGRSGK